VRLAVLLAVPAAIGLAVLSRTAPPTARGAAVPAVEFSAERALATVRALAGDGAPRPVGSAAGRRAAELLVARLRALGLDTSAQETFGCGLYGTCAAVRNVVARVGAPSPGRRAVLLAAHLDSVGAGPGVADDLSGVGVVVEVARALAAGPAPARPVVLLVTDGEEAALVGAAAFLAASPVAREVGAVVNLEARGTTGPSILFRASGTPRWLPAALAALPHPVTTSVAPAVYALLPNDTDLSAFERAGVPGVDLAFADGAVRYHTPRDDLFHLDPASLQHHGENALALVRALAAADLEDAARPAPRAWFDLLSAAVVSWPRPRAVALAAALLALAAAVVAVRREARAVRAALLGLAAALAGPLLAAAAAAGLVLALRAAGVLPRPFVAHPGAIEAAGWLAGLAGALVAPALLGRRAGRAGLLAGSALLFAALSAVLALTLPLATPIAAVPAVAFAAAEGLRGARSPGAPERLAGALPAAAAALAVAPLVVLLPSILGVFAVPVTALLVALTLGPATAAAHDVEGLSLRPGVAALGAAVLLAAVQAARPHATVDAPEKLTFTFHEDAGGARWLAEAEHDRALPAALRAAAPFTPSRRPPFAWTPLRPAFTAAAARAGLPPPRVEVLAVAVQDGQRRVRARLSSPRGAPTVALFLPPQARVRAAAVNGVPLGVPPRLALWFFGDHRLVACLTTPAAGVTVELTFEGEAPVTAFVADQSRGLPQAGAPLVAARPATAVPFWEGDSTVVTAEVRL
jgi:hypothetical protein